MLPACYYVCWSVEQRRALYACVWLLLNLCSTATGRRSAPPLNLTGLPGTEKLNEREKEVLKGHARPRVRCQISSHNNKTSFTVVYVYDSGLILALDEIIVSSLEPCQWRLLNRGWLQNVQLKFQWSTMTNSIWFTVLWSGEGNGPSFVFCACSYVRWCGWCREPTWSISRPCSTSADVRAGWGWHRPERWSRSTSTRRGKSTISWSKRATSRRPRSAWAQSK